MNVHEGARRMRRVGKWMTFGPLTMLALFILGLEITTLFRPELGSPLGLLVLVIPLVLPGATLWIASWIVEGFAKEAR